MSDRFLTAIREAFATEDERFVPKRRIVTAVSGEFVKVRAPDDDTGGDQQYARVRLPVRVGDDGFLIPIDADENGFFVPIGEARVAGYIDIGLRQTAAETAATTSTSSFVNALSIDSANYAAAAGDYATEATKLTPGRWNLRLQGSVNLRNSVSTVAARAVIDVPGLTTFNQTAYTAAPGANVWETEPYEYEAWVTVPAGASYDLRGYLQYRSSTPGGTSEARVPAISMRAVRYG